MKETDILPPPRQHTIQPQKHHSKEADELDSMCMKFGNSVKIVSGEEFRDIVRNKTHFSTTKTRWKEAQYRTNRRGEADGCIEYGTIR